MAKRTSQQTVQIEYVPDKKIRTSQQIVMLEYVPDPKIRTSQILIMVEYKPVPANGRLTGPALQVM